MREATFGWIGQAMGGNYTVLLDFQNAMRKDFGFTSDNSLVWDRDVLVWLRGIDDDLYVNFLDYLVYRKESYVRGGAL